MTPQILIVSQEEKHALDEEYKRTHEDHDGEHVCVLHERIIQDKLDVEASKRAEWEKSARWWRWLRQTYHPWHHHHRIRILAQTVRGLNFERELRGQAGVLRKVMTSPDLPGPGPLQRRPSYFRPTFFTPEYEMRVTWDTLLHKVCLMYSGYGGHSATQYSVHEGVRMVNLYVTGDSIYRERNLARTHAAITFRYWSWDMMPSDMTRPLATITIGHLVILAVRLGMQWRLLNLEKGMSADGSGYSLSSTTSDKLGLVFKLIAFAPKGPYRRLIPNKAVDKLICGILPGCSIMVRRDFDLIGPSRKCLLDLSLALDRNHILEQIGVPQQARQLLSDRVNIDRRSFPSLHNEIVPLLCTFLPLEGSDTVRHYAHCWVEKRKSVLHFWEGRYALLHYLKRTSRDLSMTWANQSLQAQPDHVRHLHKAESYLVELEDKFPKDFFGLKGREAIRGPASQDDPQAEATQKREAIVILCRSIHRWTDGFFRTLGLEGKDPQGRTHFENLVAAHLNMATHSTCSMYDSFSDSDMPSYPVADTRIPSEFDDILADVRALKDDVRPPWVLCRLIKEVEGYVKHMREGDHSVARYLQERGLKSTSEQIETAWWILMLRGIAWNMSTLDESWGDPIPSSFYDNHVPVWIT
ncbi:hypothetical protein Slin15195_G036990 [Septoria linicola]|uniref:Uncharacterized protein n=1 Tax=Septoria linicola TaxID=215465 RepID=A0A9Q9APV5_9PEZI|nr:hypothetical protein Slin15195_G036990 [Septoria linicola]